jgi:hypothetical protein
MDTTTLKGLAVALHFARCGRFIFAIKYIERQNPGISRENAIAAVASFGYREQFWNNETECLDGHGENRIRVL